MKNVKIGWAIALKDGEEIYQFPDENTDNTLRWGEIRKDLTNIKFLGILSPQNNIIGIDFEERLFRIGDIHFPFHAEGEVKPVYFISREMIINADESVTDCPKVFTVGFEDKNGKVFLNIVEDTLEVFISNCNP